MASADDTVMEAVSSTTGSSSTARFGLAVFAATGVACAIAVGLDLHNGNYKPLPYAGLAAALGAIGFVLTSRMPRHRISWVMAAGGLWWAVGALANAWAVEALVTSPGSLPGGLAAAWFDSWAWLPGLTVFASALLVLMPDGHLASRRWWPVLAATAGGCALLVPAISTSATFDLADTKVANPWSTDSGAVELAVVAGLPLVIAGLVASLAAFAVRYRRSEGDTRQQLRWVGVSLALSVVLGVAGAFLWGVVPGAAVLPALAVIALPAGIAVAVLRYRLYELDLVVNRTLVYLVLTVAVVGSYVIVVGLVGSYLSRRGDLIVSVAVTGVVAVGFQPLRAHVQRWVNRLMYGERDDPYLAIAGLGRSLASSLQVDAVLPTAVETIGRTLALQYVGVTVSEPGSESQEEVARFGAPATEVLVFPLVHQGASTGELRLSPRPGERLRERDRRLIVDLAPQVAAAAHAVELAHELQTARRRLVTLREEERRRIRRDLHDGLGPALAGLTFTIDAARNLAPSDLAEADELLASAGEQAQTLIADVRRLIYGLRPPTLDELGLIASLRALVSRESSPRTRLVVDAPDPLPPLEAALEVSAYRIVQEALTNVSRHAGATNCTIQLALESKNLLIVVSDDGCGFTDHRVGVGLHAMRERAAELGGTCEIVSARGAGTTVSVTLPREISEVPV
jgi:signal transduction histidine kinase